MQVALQVLPPLLEQGNNSQQLLVKDFVVLLRLYQQLGEVSHWVELVVFVPDLLQDRPKRKVGAVALQYKRLVGVSDLKYWGRSECGFQRLESSVAISVPNKGGFLLGQVVERSGLPREVINETSVKVCKPNESLQFCDIPWCGPLRHCFHLGGIHPYLISRY